MAGPEGPGGPEGPEGPGGPEGPQGPAGSANVVNATVSIEAQNSDDGQKITIAEAYVPNDGYIAIHDTSLLSGVVTGSVIGVSDYLEPGSYEDLQVTLFDVPGQEFDDTMLGGAQDLIAMPHRETGGNEEYNFITSEGTEDRPYTSGGSVIVAVARTTVGPNAKATLEGQESGGETVTVAEVYFPRDGYIAIHDSTLLDEPAQWPAA